MIPSLRPQQVTGQVLLVQSLHHHHDCARFLVIKRETRLPAYQSITRFLAGSDCASFAFNGSSTIMRSAPRPVSVPPTDVAYRPPPIVVTISNPVSFDHSVPGKSA